MTVSDVVLFVLKQYKGTRLHQQRVYDLIQHYYRERKLPWKADELKPTTVFRVLRKLAEEGRKGNNSVRSDGQGYFWVKMLDADADNETVTLTSFLR